MSDRIDQLRKLLEAEPDDAFCLYGLAQEYAKLGDPQKALAYFDRTIAADPAYCYAYFHKARVLDSIDDTGAAVATLRSGLEQARACGDAHAASEIASYLDELT
ncbi:MAG: tetratricopeptide repeat protein [Phycisphaerales bacterium]|nr:tetratricopeptide repeat protein [Phycisphaerales bacterium]